MAQVRHQGTLTAIEEGLVAGDRSGFLLNKWPGRAVILEFLAWLDRHPEVEEWCRNDEKNAKVVIQLLQAVHKCSRQSTSEKVDAAEQSQSNVRSTSKRISLSGWLTQWSWWRPMNQTAENVSLNAERQRVKSCLQNQAGSVLSTIQQFKTLQELLESLGFAPSGWDLSIGKLQESDLTFLLEFAKKVANDPWLIKILEALGRLRRTLDSDLGTSIEEFFELVSQRKRAYHEAIVPNIPIDISGLEFSDDIELMLPDELVFLGDERLRALWLARYAESQLSTYRVQGTEIQEQYTMSNAEQSVKRAVRGGPVIALLDTSGSMSVGVREPMAKAIILALCQMAQKQNREVFVISFSGPSQTLDFELTQDIKGLHNLELFLRKKFNGGTDVNGPLQRSVSKCITESTWKNADIAIVSDGDFALNEKSIECVRKAGKEAGLQISGFIVGDNRFALESICERNRIHDVKKWSTAIE